MLDRDFIRLAILSHRKVKDLEVGELLHAFRIDRCSYFMPIDRMIAVPVSRDGEASSGLRGHWGFR